MHRSRSTLGVGLRRGASPMIGRGRAASAADAAVERIDAPGAGRALTVVRAPDTAEVER